MKKALSILFVYLITIQSVFAATAQVNSIFQLNGKYDSAGPQSAIPLQAMGSMRVAVATLPSGYTANNYLGFYSYDSAAASGDQMQVTAGKRFVVLAFYMAASTASNANIIQFGYGTAALASNNTATPPTGNVIYGAANTPATGGFHATVSVAGAGQPSFLAYPISFPAGSFPWIRVDNVLATTQSIVMIGYEI